MNAEQLVGLTDEEAAQLEGEARILSYVLLLMNETGCSTALAIQAVEQAEADEA